MKKQNWLINPFGVSSYLSDAFFDGPYGRLQDALAKRGIELHTYDKGDLAKADMVISYCFHQPFVDMCKAAGVPREKMALIMLEPRVVVPVQYTEEAWQHFGKMFTFVDSLVDNKRFFKSRFIQGQKEQKSLPTFPDRKFLTLINAHKYSYVRNELYTLRRQAARFFEKSNDFDLYGFGWEKRTTFFNLENIREGLREGTILHMVRDAFDALRPYRCYRGSLDDKYKTLAQYRYCICFENEKEVPGYITEKIFDCFFTGTVPVYLGASNIEDYIPKEAFIDLRDFNSFEELSHYMRGLNEEAWQTYQRAGQKYLKSEAFKVWRPEGAFEELLKPFHV